MKNFIFGLILLFLVGCNHETGEPKVFDTYISFATNEGNDFFNENLQYSIDQIRYITSNPNYTSEEQEFVYKKEIDSKTIMALIPLKTPTFYIVFGNGDIDTLEQVYDPPISELGHSDDYFSDVNRIDHYYNGHLINTWDFRANTDLLFNLYEKNNPVFFDRENFDPIVINLTKTPDPDEFD